VNGAGMRSDGKRMEVKVWTEKIPMVVDFSLLPLRHRILDVDFDTSGVTIFSRNY